MQRFSENIPEECLRHLLFMINQGGYSISDKLTYTIGYCAALLDAEILSPTEWLQTYDLCSEIIYENEIHPKNHPKQG